MKKDIRFKPNVAKAIEVILWFCHQKNGKINKYNGAGLDKDHYLGWLDGKKTLQIKWLQANEAA